MFAVMCIPSHAYITVASSTKNVKVGDEFTLFVPDVPIGYVDKALWSCGDPYLVFKHKDDVSATIEVMSGFSGSAVIGVYYTEKYVTSTGHTRANTYYKEFIITASGANSSLPTGIGLPSVIEIPVGESKIIPANFTPAGSTSRLSVSSPSDEGIAYTWISVFTNLGVRGLSEGETVVTVSTENGVKQKCTIKVSPPAFPGITDESGNTDKDRNLLKAINKIDALLNTCLKYKNQLSKCKKLMDI